MARVLAVAVPAAIKANPDGRGVLEPGAVYKVGDALGSANADTDGVNFPDGGIPLSEGVQAAVVEAMPEVSVVFSPIDDGGMLLLARPTGSGGSITLTFEQRCGGDPNALCGSGGAFMMAKVNGEWKILSGGNAWIS